jgi:hypothetical protein
MMSLFFAIWLHDLVVLKPGRAEAGPRTRASQDIGGLVREAARDSIFLYKEYCIFPLAA